MVYTVFYKTSSFAGYCFLNKNSIHPKRRDVFNFKHFEVTLVKFQICSFIVIIIFVCRIFNTSIVFTVCLNRIRTLERIIKFCLPIV